MEWLKKMREKMKKSQQQVAKDIGISRQYYNLIELGKRNVPVHTAKKIAAAMNFDWQRFYE